MVRQTIFLGTLVITLFSTFLASAKDAYIPILVPITGFLSLEGTAQRNGAIAFAAIGLGLTFLGLATILEFNMDPIPVEATVLR